ncbi:hypothetical protein G6036_07805 [Streptococcus sanguinis]|uniref:hypothetical protein n=1 Tax=Streptococcus sanguinis TaxID=1305 RepID=UPI0014593B85|nr:hypothetical protein [Streptococcus sanguinis]NMH33133.1 hypothetical protein [Streptococcus sanguinis]
MERRDVTWEDVNRKERELTEFEDKYRHEKKLFERNEKELYDRFREFGNLVDEEIEKMTYVLERFSVSSEDMQDYFSNIENLMLESQTVYNQQTIKLDEKQLEYEKAFRKNRDKLEEEYYQMRKRYESSNK